MERDEDSGLHDIRSMASSTKMRLSSRRTTQPPVADDDILASSSAGWKAVALPEPARMVSLPEIPTENRDPEAKPERKSKKDLKTKPTSAKKIATDAIAVETSAPTPVAPVAAAPVAAAVVAKPVAEAPVAPVAFSAGRFSKPPQKSKTGLYSAIGLGLAAAAGVGWYVSTQMTSSSNSAAEQVSMAPAAQPAPVTATPITNEPAPAAPVAAPAVEEKPADVATGMGEGKAADSVAIATDDERSQRGGKAAAKNKKDDKKVVVDLNSGPKRAEPPKEVAKEPETKAEPKGDGEPSFDQLLKEAGVQDKKPQKPKLDKKSLSGADIKKGMGSVAGNAQACFNGTQGTAIVKLTVAPSGQVEKVKVSGVFAGTQVGACVEAAVRNAKFPAWDGGPQSFGYSYLLAE